MRRTVRLGTIGLAIGLIFMAVAPTNARAITPISIFDDFNTFPDSVVGPPALPDRGLAVAFKEKSGFTTFPFSNGFGEIRDQVREMLPAFGLIVAANQRGLEIYPFNFGEDEQGQAGAVGAPEGGVVAGENDVPGASQGTSGNGSVTTAPEPATWIMMILGFWIAAWRLRRLSEGDALPAQGLSSAC